VIQPPDRDSFISLSAALENSELSSLVFESMDPNITLDNTSGRMDLKFDANLGIEAEIEFLTRDFARCSMYFLISVDFDIMCQI
jgi:hypothetical protein